MYLLLIRHPESEKNILNTFSSIQDNEELTQIGIQQSIELAKGICEIIDRHNFNVKNIYCANSRRAISSTKIIADFMNTNYVICEDLVSTKAGVLAGINEKDATMTHSGYMKQLYLYRKGLYNAYRFNVAEGKENKKKYEKKVITCLHEIIKNTEDNFIVIITHRSPITTILTDFAKKYYDYPKNFLGYIQLDLSKISWLKRQNKCWEICGVNQTVNEFLINFQE